MILHFLKYQKRFDIYIERKLKEGEGTMTFYTIYTIGTIITIINFIVIVTFIINNYHCEYKIRFSIMSLVEIVAVLAMIYSVYNVLGNIFISIANPIIVVVIAISILSIL